MCAPLASDGGSPRSSVGGRRMRVLDQLKRNLQSHPATANVRYEESGTGADWRLVAALDCSILVGRRPSADEARVFVNWWTHPSPTRDRFKIHYAESNGFDCGWHRQANDHVDGLGHYQERTSSDEEYTYEPVDFEYEGPVGLLWETLDERLKQRLERRSEGRDR